MRIFLIFIMNTKDSTNSRAATAGKKRTVFGEEFIILNFAQINAPEEKAKAEAAVRMPAARSLPWKTASKSLKKNACAKAAQMPVIIRNAGNI